MIADTFQKPQGFDSLSLVEQIEGSREWALQRALGYWVDDPETDAHLQRFAAKHHHLIQHWGYSPIWAKVTVHAGFITDFASVPRPVWSIVSPDDIRRPAILHDALYRDMHGLMRLKVLDRRHARKFRKLADRIFREAMDYASPPIPWWKKTVAYKAVRWFGGFTYDPSKSVVSNYNLRTRKPK